MLKDAIESIRFAEYTASLRRMADRRRRQQIRLLDHWMGEIEMLMVQDKQVVPEPLINEIAGFVGELSPRLHDRLQPRSGRSASMVLDVLFDAEEQLLPNPPHGSNDGTWEPESPGPRWPGSSP